MIQLDLTGITLPLKKEQGKVTVYDPFRKRWIALMPEEQVRQYLVRYMTDTLQYPAGMIAIEKQIIVGNRCKRFDLVVYDRSHIPWMLVECKAPEVSISEKTLHQLLNYHRAIPCRYWLLSNGHQHYCADASNREQITWLTRLPAYDL